MTPPLNEHKDGAGFVWQEGSPPGCLGYLLLPVAIVVIIAVAAWLAWRDR